MDINASKTALELFALYDVIVLDSLRYKEWYGSYRNYIRGVAHIKSIYLYPKHIKINDDLQKKLKNDWLVDSIIKYLPSVFTGKSDLIEKLLAGHLSGVDLPSTESCVKDVLIYLGQKFGCVHKD